MKLRLLILAVLLAGAGQSANLPLQWVLHSPGNLVAELGSSGGGGLDWPPFGGIVTNYVLDGTNYTLHMFTNTVQNAFLNFGATIQCDVLVVAGGGAGGNIDYYTVQSSGGGGAGGISYQHNRAVTQGIHTVFVGSGGIGSSGNLNGGDSCFADIISTGGGYGGGSQSVANNGGSGGGSTDFGEGGLTIQTNTSGAVGFGSDGGGSTNGVDNASGGGGAISAGGAGGSDQWGSGGTGGEGLTFDISGALTYYGGGGGGGGGYGGMGGQGGGGTGEGIYSGDGSPGTPNTGGGGGGRRKEDYESYYGYDGGSGVVILRFPPRPRPLSAIGGTITTTDTWIVHTFNEVGAHTFTVLGDGAITCEVFAVGGGGAGSDMVNGAGGGGGGVKYGCVTQTEGSVKINVGYGGAAGYQGDPEWVAPTSGGNSSFGTNFIALGGGYGGCDGAAGGCGGGGGYDIPLWSTYSGGAGSQGGDGGEAMFFSLNVEETIYDYWGGGGGGGAKPENGGDGLIMMGETNPPTSWSTGGDGFYTNFDGTATYYGGGGGGRFEIYENGIQTTDYYADGGQGGGGGGSGAPSAGGDGLGGGGSGGYGGGSGIVIIRYKP